MTDKAITDQQDQSLLLVIFGITGDLAQRYILPALHGLLAKQQLPGELKIIGVSRRDVALDDVYEKLADNASDYEEAVATSLRAATEMRRVDMADASDYTTLLESISQLESHMPRPVQRLYYLSIPPNAFLQTVQLLGQTGHADTLPAEPNAPRLLIEKPFGSDLASARTLFAAMAEHFSEDQTYRIDHYVAKRMVQQMVDMRFNDDRFSSVWHAGVRSVKVAAHEELAIEGRSDFYEQTGALRDLIQSHLLQVLALTLMPKPDEPGSAAQHAARLQALMHMQPIADPATDAERGQYDGYTADVENPASTTETFARVSLRTTAHDWHDCLLTLETGKALAERLAYIELRFDTPREIDGVVAKALRFRIQPDAAVLAISDNQGEELATPLQSHAAAASIPNDGYERVLLDAFAGDHTTFSTADEIIRAWEIIEPVLEAWSDNGDGLQIYRRGAGAADIAA